MKKHMTRWNHKKRWRHHNLITLMGRPIMTSSSRPISFLAVWSWCFPIIVGWPMKFFGAVVELQQFSFSFAFVWRNGGREQFVVRRNMVNRATGLTWTWSSSLPIRTTSVMSVPARYTGCDRWNTCNSRYMIFVAMQLTWESFHYTIESSVPGWTVTFVWTWFSR